MGFLSCKKEISPAVGTPPNVYVAGNETNGTISAAVYWKNGTRVILSDVSKSSQANSIVVSGNNVFVAGAESNGIYYVAKYWKNGESVNLTDGTVDAIANSIAVLGNDVYVTGFNGGTPYPAAPDEIGNHAFYWKNGKIVYLSEGAVPATSSEATAVFVSGNDVYVSGGIAVINSNGDGVMIPVYWKNNQLVEMGENQFFAEGVAIMASGNDVYMAGVDDNDVEIWKNGKPVNLSSDLVNVVDINIKSIFVSGNDIYAAGTGSTASGLFGPPSRTYGEYWKNGIIVNLSNQADSTMTRANSIFVSGTDVYVAGSEAKYRAAYSSSRAVYWKNELPVVLSDLPSVATSIFIANQ